MEALQKPKVWLRSSDNKEFEMNESAAIQSVTLKKMIEVDCADKVIPLPNVTSHILVKVIEYCNKHAEPTGPGEEDRLKIFDADIVNVDKDTLIDLLLAASYLDIKGLLNLTRQTIKGKDDEVCTVKIQEKLSTSSTSALATTMSSKEKQMDASSDAYSAQLRENSLEMLTCFADRAAEYRKCGRPLEQPPLEMINHPDLFERAWGWDSILPYLPGSPWSLYMTYLREYYKKNSPVVLAHHVEAYAATCPDLSGDDGNDMSTLFQLCINMEGELLNKLSCCDKKHNVDEISLKDKLTNFDDQTPIMKYAGFTATSVALKCIMAEACLLFKLLMSKTGMIREVIFCSKIRKCAFGFMAYEGPRCFEAAATMMAITKEAKSMCELLENKCVENGAPFLRSVYVRQRTFDAMLRIWKECFAVEDSTGDSTASKLIHDESGDKNASEKEVANTDNLLQRNKMNQNTKICSMEELPKENHLDERNEDECYDKTGSEMGIDGENIGEMNVVKQTSKVCNGSDDKASLKENAVVNTNKPRLEDSLKTSSGNKKDQGKSKKGRRQCRRGGRK